MAKIAIIGGGASGMFCGICSADGNNIVDIYEKNEKLGKKLYITGKGRCNLTNNCDISEFFENINRNSEFLYSSLYGFTNFDLVSFFEKRGLKTKTERGNRVFPSTDKSSDVIKVLENILVKKRVNVKLNSEVKELKKMGMGFLLSSNAGKIYYDKVVVATGGISYPKTGSTGFGYEIGENFGHSIIKTVPVLVGINTKEDYALSGVSLKNINLSLTNGNKILWQEFGELLFTHGGLSGPVVLRTSVKIYDVKDRDLYLSIDLKPALTHDVLNKRILRDFQKYSNKNIVNGLKDLLIQSLIPVILKISNIPEETKVNQITSVQRRELVNKIKNFKFTFKSLRSINEAVITRGGINVKEINPYTMESKICKNLFFIGEVLDVDANTGGFNLQIAFSTAYAAGRSLCKNE